MEKDFNNQINNKDLIIKELENNIENEKMKKRNKKK